MKQSNLPPRAIVLEEVFGQNDTKLFIELIQTASTYFAWAEAIKRRIDG